MSNKPSFYWVCLWLAIIWAALVIDGAYLLRIAQAIESLHSKKEE